MSIISLRDRQTDDSAEFGRAKRSASSLIYARRCTPDGSYANLPESDIELELTVGDRWAPTMGGDNPQFFSTAGKPIRIAPNASVVIETAEEIQVPNNVMGVVFPKGSLFREKGLHPLTAKIDPTWSGRLRLLVQNSSDAYRDISVGASVATVVFFSMETTVLSALRFGDQDLPVVPRSSRQKIIGFVERPSVYTVLGSGVVAFLVTWVTLLVQGA